MREKILHEVQRCARAWTDDPLQESTSLVDDLHMDSLDIVEFAMALENAFNFQITDDELMRLRTVGDYVELIMVRNCDMEM